MSSAGFAKTPNPPYYAAIFTSLRTEGDKGYSAMAERMVELASEQSGFLGIESVRGDGGIGITVSYWESEEAIRAWKKNAEHQAAQRSGQQTWYQGYMLRVAKSGEGLRQVAHLRATVEENGNHDESRRQCDSDLQRVR